MTETRLWLEDGQDLTKLLLHGDFGKDFDQPRNQVHQTGNRGHSPTFRPANAGSSPKHWLESSPGAFAEKRKDRGTVH